jgi:Ca-activated chloride channel family protein
MIDLHWIRPYWLLGLIPLGILSFLLLRHQVAKSGWIEICDPHLLRHQLDAGQKQRRLTILPFILSLFLMTLGLAGPSWIKLPTPTYETIMPRVILLDMSSSMMASDVKPTRLFRAKLLIRDALSMAKEGQFALIAYSGMPFVVSPLTQDNNTIISLLSALTDSVMPVDGQNLAAALVKAKQLVVRAGFHRADFLVISANSISAQAVDTAKQLSKENFHTSILSINSASSVSKRDKALATAGLGQMISFKQSGAGLRRWLVQSEREHELRQDVMNNVPLWKDEGHWLILLSLLCLLPIFRRGYLEALA